ncbi:MAG: hypothetical protein EPO67_11600 [Reyranella sp.]|nr:MAG: hypothetical protein EPO67_11600 [Reyranella sp.]
MQSQPAEVETLKRRVFEAHAEARAAVRTYNRGTWLRFSMTFVPVPLLVVAGRLYFVDWHYYVLGGAFLVVALAMYELDSRAAGRRDKALKAAKEARTAYRLAKSGT